MAKFLKVMLVVMFISYLGSFCEGAHFIDMNIDVVDREQIKSNVDLWST